MQNSELRTCDSILFWLHDQTESRRPIDPHTWMEVAQALNVLSSDENDKLIELEHKLALMRADEVAKGKTVAAAKIVIEASIEFNEARKQRAKMKQIEEAIRLAKLSARIKSDEMRNSL